VSPLRILVWVGLGIAAIHGFIYRQTGELDPCSAATKRLAEEYPLSTVGFGPDYLDALPGSSDYGPHSPYFRKSMAKSETLKRFGIVGCYVPAVLGWGAVPPSPSHEFEMR
jgi:hypothetical protein